MLIDNFAVLIISHGRPNDIPTIETLKKAKYTGKIYVVVDNQDKYLNEYKQLYNNLIIFNKQYYINNAISFNCEPLINVAVHARNACEDVAKELDLKYFLLLDDDIVNFQYKFLINDKRLSRVKAFNFDYAISLYIEYMKNANIATIGIANEGYFLGGNILTFTTPNHSKFRLLSNAFLRNVAYEVKWSPDMCEDFITSVLENRKGNIWLSLPFLSCGCRIQGMNKKEIDGGNSSIYMKRGNYGVAIYSVLNLPDSFKLIFKKNKLWFECINHNLTVPKIISCKYKK